MIDKQKLLQWVDDTYEISSHPADADEKPERVAAWKAEAALMYKLKRLIEFGNFDADEDEGFRPRFKMDAVGNLTLVEDDAE